MRYNWQDTDWPNFRYSISDEVQNWITLYERGSRRLAAGFAYVDIDIKNETLIDLMVSEAIKTSAIEGERFDDADVRSSIRNQLGLSTNLEHVKDVRAINLAKLMINIRNTFHTPLSEQILFE